MVSDLPAFLSFSRVRWAALPSSVSKYNGFILSFIRRTMPISLDVYIDDSTIDYKIKTQRMPGIGNSDVISVNHWGSRST